MDGIENLLIRILAGLGAAFVIVLIVLLLRRPKGAADIAVPLQHLTQSIAGVQIELRGLLERVTSIEKNQSQVSQNISAIGTGLTQTGAVAQNLMEATSAIRGELSRAKNDLSELQAHARARQELEVRTADSIRRLEAIIAGTQTKGSAGENIIEVVFAKLPPEWQVRDFRVGDKYVEFGLRLPNNLVLPIDSKWAATSLLEEFISCDDPAEQLRIKSQVEAAVLSRTKEVRKYIDPNLTVNFAVATVPDAVYDLCCGIQSETFQLNVMLVPYSMLVPYLLLVFQMILGSSQSIDLQRLNGYLQSAEDGVRSLQEELEGRFSRAVTMLSNSRDDMALQLSKLNAGLTSLQAYSSECLPPALSEQ
ncbi:MAG: DNA recombination protein RmuC [Armatimonadetes bacterium]|nr:DNA recombination protein RmuC [Armatimonadota bacterium]